MFKQCVSSYCFNRLLKTGDITLSGAMQFAHSVGFDSIELLDVNLPKNTSPAALARELRRDAEAAGLDVACYTVHNDLGLFDRERWQTIVDRMLEDVAMAAALGAPTMRVESTAGPTGEGRAETFERYLERVAAGLKEVSRRAAENGIQVALENHGRYIATSRRVLSVIEAVDETNFGACIDIANFLCVDEDPVDAVSRLAPHARHVHVKDMHIFDGNPSAKSFQSNEGRNLLGAVLDEGVIEVARVLRIIARRGYTGALSLEFEGPENVFYGVARGARRLQEHIRRLTPA